MKTYMAKADSIEKKWYVVDAEDNKKFRILLTAAVKYVLANGLFIIGLKRTERV